jgi:photosynthetic reaction center cytochrome c subunit
MTAMSSWIAPEQSCEYCHNLANFAEDSKYTKVVARRMIQMTQHVNTNYRAHVGQTGVTCYTCHRGNAVPAVTWSQAVPQLHGNDHELILFQEVNQHGLISIHYHCVGVHNQHV